MLEEVPVTANSSGARKGVVVLALVVAAVLVLIGLRIKSAVSERASVAAQQKTVVAQAAAETNRPPVVPVVRGEPVSWVPRVPLEGSLSPQREAELGFKVPGRLAAIKVKVGDRIRAGQVLATLDVAEAAVQLQAAEAQLAAAEAQAALAGDAARRTETVVSSGAQSEAVGVQAREQRKLAEAQRDAARAQVEAARRAHGNHTLAAPFAGTITRVPPAPGAVVAPGAPLFHLSDLSILKLVGTVSESDAGYARVGAEVEVLGAVSDEVVAKGKVAAVVPALDPQTKRVPVEVTIANANARAGEASGPGLLAGALVRARIVGGQPIPVLRLPAGVLRPGSQDEVLVVKENRLLVRRVEHTVAADGSLQVRRGLAAGDAVLARPWPEAREGMPVSVRGDR
jgi:RND family efflux transporter MFP subunit